MLDRSGLHAFNVYERPHADLRESVARVEAATKFADVLGKLNG
jgi:hypothetical protein